MMADLNIKRAEVQSRNYCALEVFRGGIRPGKGQIASSGRRRRLLRSVMRVGVFDLKRNNVVRRAFSRSSREQSALN